MRRGERGWMEYYPIETPSLIQEDLIGGESNLGFESVEVCEKLLTVA